MTIATHTSAERFPAADAAPDADPHIECWTRHGVAGDSQWFLVPSAAGARLFRKHGWPAYARAVSGWAQASGVDLDASRLVDQLPRAGSGLTPRPVLPRKLSSRRTSDGGFEVEFVVPFDLALFAGHFAAAPIVPGAVLVGWAGRIAAAEAAWAHGTAHVRSMKFRRIVQPGPRYSLTGHCTSGGDRLDVRIESTQGLHVSATLLADD